jgi:hypothetical protein
MVAYSFMVFLPDLLSGKKTHTIRRLNIDRIEQSNRLGMQIYWKQRKLRPRDSKEPHLLFNAKFVKAQILQFTEEWWPCAMGWIEPMPSGHSLHVSQWPASITMTVEDAGALARRDGFDSTLSMQAQFRKMYKDAHQGTWVGIYFTPYLTPPEHVSGSRLGPSPLQSMPKSWKRSRVGG